MIADRLLFVITSAAVALMTASGASAADPYPTRPVRFLVGFPANGPNDILARLMGEWLGRELGQPFVVENQPGKSGNIATETVVRAPADGYTILLVGPANAISASLDQKLPFVFLRDIAPVGGITREPLVMVVNPAVPARTAAEFIAYAKANPGRLKLASTGNGSAPHVTAELFRMMTGADVPIVHFAGGGPALKGLASGEAAMMFEPLSAAFGHIRSGELRALAVTTAQRVAALPDIPTLAETVPGFEASAATGIGVPRNTPADVIATLNRAMNAAYADAMMRARFADTGGVVLPGSPADFGRILAEETEKWAKVVKSSGAKPD